jgi:hypothetical protein
MNKIILAMIVATTFLMSTATFDGDVVHFEVAKKGIAIAL